MNEKLMIVVISILFFVILIVGFLNNTHYRIIYGITKSEYMNDRYYCETDYDCVSVGPCVCRTWNKYYKAVHYSEGPCECMGPSPEHIFCIDNNCRIIQYLNEKIQ